MNCIYNHLAVKWLLRSFIDDEMDFDFENLGTEPDGTWLYFRRVDDPTQHPRHSYIRINAADIDTYSKESEDCYSILG